MDSWAEPPQATVLLLLLPGCRICTRCLPAPASWKYREPDALLHLTYSSYGPNSTTVAALPWFSSLTLSTLPLPQNLLLLYSSTTPLSFFFSTSSLLLYYALFSCCNIPPLLKISLSSRIKAGVPSLQLPVILLGGLLWVPVAPSH